MTGLGFDTHCVVTPELNEPVVEAVLRAPAEDIARLPEVCTRLLAYGRPTAPPSRVDL
ncbi:hypothetical protein ACTU45_24465 [Streptomyces sp. 24-1644]|uniref:hypothetical protein n=1 Tax=Streptomyces sp. 24-1644 TaxID=3457315 RepID=UPI003FA6A054